MENNTTTQNQTTLSIYVASLSDYNNGILHGCWIDCTQGSNHVWEEINAMLLESPTARKYGEKAEEWAIHDFDFEGVQLGESENIDELCELAEAIEEHGEAFAVYAESTGDWSSSNFEDAYCGTYRSELEYAEEIADECLLFEVPENIRFYFDYEKFARDLFMSDYFSEDVSGGMAIFRYI